MSIVLWILQIVLALAFIAAGFMKAFQPYETMAARMSWVEDYSPGTVRILGALEILGGIGLVLPAAIGIFPALVPIAAIGLAIIMVLATLLHVRRQETGQVGFTIVLLALLLFVAFGRFVLAPF